MLAGELTLTALADEKGVSRQAAHATWKSRGWSTRASPEALEQLGGHESHERDWPGVDHASAAPTVPTSRRSTPSAPITLPSMPSGAPGPASAPGKALYEATDGDDLREALRQELGNVAMLALAAATSILSRPVGPSGLKATMGAVALATQQLALAGYGLGDEGPKAQPTLIIESYTQDELAKIEAQAEREHRGLAAVDD